MNVVEIASLRPVNSSAARFQGLHYGSNVSFFVVTSPPGRGAEKHRHPYEETYVILEGTIELIVEGELRVLEHDTIAVIPANSWHEFKNCSDRPVLLVNIHPVPMMIQEDWELP